MPNFTARSLRQQRTDSVGIIVPKVNSDSVSNLIEGVSSVLNQSGYMAIFRNAENDEKREVEYLSMMQEAQIAGIILMGTILTPKHIRFFKESRIPVVVCGQNHPSVTCIYHDDRCAAREIARYVIAKGKRKLAYVGATETDESVGANRRIGVEEAMIEACISPTGLVRTQVRFTSEEGCRGMKEILDGGFVPDCVICATDTLAVGAMKALRERGYSIPDDIGAVGIGGSKAAEQLLSMIRYQREHPDEKLPVTHTMLGYTLLERDSV